jgi:hypothetical protein
MIVPEIARNLFGRKSHIIVDRVDLLFLVLRIYEYEIRLENDGYCFFVENKQKIIPK